jgi:alginate O-acetyltransferase complex protein AlgI
MIFSELRFLAFFAFVFGVHWALRSNTARKRFLLLVSYAFYAAWDVRFLSLILLSTFVDYFVGRALGAPGRSDRSRKRLLATSVVVNLGLLGVFKYCDFFVSSAAALLAWLGLGVSFETLGIVLPVGISFYTFQTMSYTLDVYAGKLAPRKRLLDIALFVAFFPQLVAGPIVRAKTYLPQLDEARSFARVPVRACLVLFLTGLIKKSCVSDNLSPFVDEYFAAPEQYTALSAWIAVLLYAVQIYCDFSGYSDMAIACAGLLGYRLCANFAFPYCALSITDFWRRWHISLSSWLRDYLYIPLGGNRGTKWFTYRNLMWTMLLGGLWHGAAWRFVVWGGLHGLALIAAREWSARVRRESLPFLVARFLGRPLTFYWVCLAWIFFRAQDMDAAWTTVKSYVLLRSPGTAQLDPVLLLVFAALALVHVAEFKATWTAALERIPRPVFAVGYALAFHAALLFFPANVQPFIYFQF